MSRTAPRAWRPPDVGSGGRHARGGEPAPPEAEATATAAALPSAMDRPAGASVRRRRTLMRWLAATVLACLVVGLIVYLRQLRLADVAVDARNIQVETATYQPLAEVAAFSGRVQPIGLLRIDAAEAAIVAAKYVSSGTLVVTGQPLLRLSSPEREAAISNRIAQIQSDINALRGQKIQIAQSQRVEAAEIREARYNLQRADTVLRRQETLLRSGVVNDAYVAPARNEHRLYASALPELTRARDDADRLRSEQRRAIVEQEATLQDNLRAARSQLDAFTIRSPRPGRVLGLDLEVGALVAQGARLAQIDPRSGLGVEARLDEFYASRVGIGMAATLVIQGRDVPVVIDQVFPDINDGTFRIAMTFAAVTPASLRPGETVRGRLKLGSERRALAIPNGPFMQTSGGAYVFVYDPESGVATKRAIKVGIRDPEHVEVLSGLRPGERVIVSDYGGFETAARIRVEGRPAS